MASPVRNLVAGTVVAVVLAALLSVPAIASISTWKWALGLLGLFLWFLAERARPSRK
jgi:hypothetical protein